MATRPARYHRAIEALTAQDIAVFFQEGLAALPDLAARLAGGGRVLDVHCGGGRWLIAIADPVPRDDPGRGRARAGFAGPGGPPRPGGRPVGPDHDRGPAGRGPALAGRSSTWSTSRTRSTIWPIRSPRCGRRGPASGPAAGSSSSTGACPRPAEESRSVHGAMMWGIQLDQLFQGTRLWDHAGFANLFVAGRDRRARRSWTCPPEPPCSSPSGP